MFEYGEINPTDIEFSETIRGYCASNVCRQYGRTWACPPAVGSVDECRKRTQHYEKMIVFSIKFDIEDMADTEEIKESLLAFKCIVNAFDDEIKTYISDFLLLGNESCANCKVCTYPDEPCRFPEKVHHAIEGYGIFVAELAKQAGIAYFNGSNTITYFGALLYNEHDVGSLTRSSCILPPKKVQSF
jgi:predicted metal-binding protein